MKLYVSEGGNDLFVQVHYRKRRGRVSDLKPWTFDWFGVYKDI